MTQFTNPAPFEPAKELHSLLNEIGWTNGQVAELAAVTPNTVSRWLHRKTTVPELVLKALRQEAVRHRAKLRRRVSQHG